MSRKEEIASRYIETLKHSHPKLMQVGLTKLYFICNSSIMDSICKSMDLIHWEIQPQMEGKCELAKDDQIIDYSFSQAFISCVSEFEIPLMCKLDIINDDVKLVLHYEENARPDMLSLSLEECKNRYLSLFN